jgi:glycosyltransferase involved in cell wall biosynthesis
VDTAARPRIAYMTGEYLRLSPFVFIHREVSALRRQGFHVETFSIRGLDDPSEAVNDAQRAERLTTFVVLPAPIGRLLGSHARLLADSPGRWWRALRLAWATRPPGWAALFRQLAYFAEAGIVADRMRERGLVHLHNHFASSSGTVAMLAAALGDFTFSISEHGPDIFFAPHWWRLDAKFSRALFVACISHFCRSQVLIWTPVERWNRVHIVHCGVDPAEFSPRSHSARGYRLLFTGRLAAVKGLPILLDAVSRLTPHHPAIELALAGDGPDRAALERQAAELGIADRVRFLGYQSSDQVRALLQETDVFVLPSFAEGVPVVLMEAMASGVPVVATRVAGITELVADGGSGYVVPPGDVAALVASIDALLSDPALRARFGAAGRAAVEREFDVGAEAAWLGELLSSALGGVALPLRPKSSSVPVAAMAPRTCPTP